MHKHMIQVVHIWKERETSISIPYPFHWAIWSCLWRKVSEKMRPYNEKKNTKKRKKEFSAQRTRRLLVLSGCGGQKTAFIWTPDAFVNKRPALWDDSVVLGEANVA